MWKDNHFFGATEEKKVKKRLKRCVKYIQSIRHHSPKTEWAIVLFLESTGYSKKQYRQYIKSISHLVPEDIKLIINATEGHIIRAYDSAGHHTWFKDGHAVFSFDGMDAKDADVEGWKDIAKNCKWFLFWTWSYNLKFSHKDSRSRVFRTSPPQDGEITGMCALAGKKGDTRLPAGWIWKVFAERYIFPLARSNRPTLLCDVKDALIHLVSEGDVIATLTYDKEDPHQAGRYIYRLNDWGWKVADKIKGDNLTADLVVNLSLIHISEPTRP